MKTPRLPLLLLIILVASVNLFAQKAGKREYYQLKTYTLASPAQEEMIDNYLKNAYLPALHRAKISSVGVFKTIISEKDTTRRVYVLIPFDNLSDFEALDEKLAKDQAYQQAGADYINAPYNNAPYKRIESALMKAFVDMPKMATPSFDTPKASRVYELRSYESATEKLYVNKVDMFNAGGEIPLFDKLGFNAVFYGEVLSGASMPNLIYMTTFSDMASRDAHWKSFVDAPEWKVMSALPKYQKNVSRNDTRLLYPADYSDY